MQQIGGFAPDTLKELAGGSDVIVTMLPTSVIVERVLSGGDDNIFSGMKPGTIVIDMSSISPIETQEFAKKIEALGCDYVDAPVSGGEVGAKAYDGGRFPEAIKLFSDMSLAPAFEEFLTLPAYRLID